MPFVKEEEDSSLEPIAIVGMGTNLHLSSSLITLAAYTDHILI